MKITAEHQYDQQDASIQSDTVWGLAWQRFKRNRISMFSMWIVLAFMIMILLTSTGMLAKNWDQQVAISNAPPSFIAASQSPPPQLTEAEANDTSLAEAAQAERYGIADPLAQEMQSIEQQLATVSPIKTELKTSLLFGADRWGQDIIQKTMKAAETSILVGIIAALLAVLIGSVLGAISGYFGGWVDDLINWFYNIFTAIPGMLLILALAAVLQQKGMLSLILILGLTGWTGTYRLMRAEYMKHVEREYVLAAKAIGVTHYRRIFIHIFPNVSHVALVQCSLLVVAFIKSEVILTFLGFGMPVGTISWGSMLNEAQGEFNLGKWWQLVAATSAMALLVTAFSIFTDALRDALDPKLK